MILEPKVIWMNGELVAFEKATVHFFVSSLHYGTGVFEGIRCYDTEKGPAVFRLTDHMKRLVDSARVLGIYGFQYSVEELCEATRQVITANEFKACYIRPLVYHTNSFPTLVLSSKHVGFGIGAWELGIYLGEEAFENGVRAHVSSFTRHHTNIMMTKAKVTGNYANSALAKTEASQLGFDEGIMLDPQGFVAECTGENIFLVRNGDIITPPTATILEGITRDAIIRVATDLGYRVIEQPVSRDQLYIADEVFVCGTAAECVAIREIDSRAIGSGKMGPITRRLQKVFFDIVHGKIPEYLDWLDYV